MDGFILFTLAAVASPALLFAGLCFWHRKALGAFVDKNAAIQSRIQGILAAETDLVVFEKRLIALEAIARLKGPEITTFRSVRAPSAPTETHDAQEVPF
jgi:hypothetical protein